MSADIPAAPARPRERRSLAVGDVVQVIAATYSAVRVGTVGRVARVLLGPWSEAYPLYELEHHSECYFWGRELAWAGRRSDDDER